MGVIVSEGSTTIRDITGKRATITELDNFKALDVCMRGEDGYPVQVGPEGRLHVTLANPVSTFATTKVSQRTTYAVAGHSYYTNSYLIPTDNTLIITKIELGGQIGSNQICLFYAPNGSLDGNEELIKTYFTNGISAEFDLDEWYEGDGTARVFTRLRRLDKGKRLITVKWEGYLIP